MTATEPTAPGLLLRPATQSDLPLMADVFWQARAAAAPAMPAPVRTREEVVDFYRRLDLASPGREAWVAEDERGVVGFAELKDDWLDDLYVLPEAQGEGIGSALLDLVKSLRTGGFQLWVFESNAPARAFYAAHGLVELEVTDGRGNQEQSPDIRVEWRRTRSH